jgi:general secretion pathway protein G
VNIKIKNGKKEGTNMFLAMRKNLKNQKGFTLIELLAVIAIIGILAAIAVPKFQTANARANTAKIASDLATIDEAMTMYIANNPTYAPVAGAIPAAVAPNYLASIPIPPANGQIYYAAPAATPSAASAAITSAGGTYTLANIGTIAGVVILQAEFNGRGSACFH